MTYHSYNQEQLRVLSDLIVADLDNIFRYFEVDLVKTNKKYYGGCPIHKGGSDKSPFNLFITGDYFTGNWKCRSRQCEQTFKKTPIGLIRGLLSAKDGWSQPGDKTASFDQAVKWCESWTKQDLASIKVDPMTIKKNSFIAQKWAAENKAETMKLSREQVKGLLTLPSAYFKKRGYTESILSRYCVGDCLKPGKEMAFRAVVPIFDHNGEYIIGCAGRSIFPQCSECKLWHDPENKCPETELDRYLSIKWRNNKGFCAENHLYNYWMAKTAIEKDLSITLVESSGNTWKLIENNVHTVVGTFGAHLTENQTELILKSPALVVNVIADNDLAGKEMCAVIKQKLSSSHQLNFIDFPEKYNDLSEMSNEEIAKIIVPRIKVYKL